MFFYLSFPHDISSRGRLSKKLGRERPDASSILDSRCNWNLRKRESEWVSQSRSVRVPFYAFCDLIHEQLPFPFLWLVRLSFFLPASSHHHDNNDDQQRRHDGAATGKDYIEETRTFSLPLWLCVFFLRHSQLVGKRHVPRPLNQWKTPTLRLRTVARSFFLNIGNHRVHQFVQWELRSLSPFFEKRKRFCTPS